MSGPAVDVDQVYRKVLREKLLFIFHVVAHAPTVLHDADIMLVQWW
jgi:hypothetical protein